MNYLAHAYLADGNSQLRVGSAFGDFFKGPIPDALPIDLARGVRLHRAIDSFAETHPAFRASRKRFPTAMWRWSGVIVDIYYDHLLARDWISWHAESLPRFSAQLYADLLPHLDLLGADARHACELMATEDWLAGYASEHGLANTLVRMGHRVRRSNPLAGSESHLFRLESEFQSDFATFLADAQAFANTWLSAQAKLSATPTVLDPERPGAD